MEKINVAGLLKNCPKGMELDCTCADNVVFDKIIEYEQIKCVIGDCHDPLILDKYGRLLYVCFPKCVIFPKGKTTWKGFVPPCQFKDGDIVFTRTNIYEWVSIFKKFSEKCCYTYANLCIKDNDLRVNTLPLCHIEDIKTQRLATEEEKAKLFQAIKVNGYKWNSETKTLDKLIEPKFKVGDRVKKIATRKTHVISHITESGYVFQDEGGIGFIFGDEHIYELVSDKFAITTLKPFDKVLVRGDVGQKWTHDFFGFMDKDKGYPFVCVGHYVIQCIPYEHNEHLLGTTDDCDEYFKTWK